MEQQSRNTALTVKLPVRSGGAKVKCENPARKLPSSVAQSRF